MLNKKMLAAGLVMASAVAGVAQAEGYYVGLEANRLKAVDVCDGIPNVSGVSCDDTDTGFHIYGGYNVNEYLSLEAGYRDLGEYGLDASLPGVVDGELSFEARALDFAAVGHLPVSDSFSFYGKVGMTYWDADADVDVTIGADSYVGSDDARGLDPLLGVGAEWNLGVVSLTAGVERLFDIGDSNHTTKQDLDAYSLGVKYNFK